MINEIKYKMIQFSNINENNRNVHDINHFLKVYEFAKIIGEKEKLDIDTLETLEIAAIIHDIACPLCRSKYGNTNGKYQEIEGYPLAKEFLKEFDLREDKIERIAYLVGHHHTLDKIDGIDYQILIEADYLVNAYESKYPIASIQNMRDHVFKTNTGIELIENMYLKRG